jgi:hypothetical protein
VVIAEDERLKSDLPHRRDHETFEVVWDAIPPEHFSSLVSDHLDRVLSAVMLVLPSNVSNSVEKIADVSFLIDESTGKPAYSFNFKGSARAYVSGALDNVQIDSIRKVFTKFSETPQLDTPIRLLSRSLRTDDVDPRSFLAAWAALEIFIYNLFTSYEADWNISLRQDKPAAAQRYFDSVGRIMQGKFNLVDKFSVVASILSPENSAYDLSKLQAAKESRDEFYHALGPEPSRQESLTLLLKYLRRHLLSG